MRNTFWSFYFLYPLLSINGNSPSSWSATKRRMRVRATALLLLVYRPINTDQDSANRSMKVLKITFYSFIRLSVPVPKWCQWVRLLFPSTAFESDLFSRKSPCHDCGKDFQSKGLKFLLCKIWSRSSWFCYFLFLILAHCLHITLRIPICPFHTIFTYYSETEKNSFNSHLSCYSPWVPRISYFSGFGIRRTRLLIVIQIAGWFLIVTVYVSFSRSFHQYSRTYFYHFLSPLSARHQSPPTPISKLNTSPLHSYVWDSLLFPTGQATRSYQPPSGYFITNSQILNSNHFSGLMFSSSWAFFPLLLSIMVSPFTIYFVPPPTVLHVSGQ